MVVALAGASVATAGPSQSIARPQTAAVHPAKVHAPSHLANAVFDSAPPPPAMPVIAGDELWSNQFMLGANNSVYAAVVAANGDLYVGGEFTAIAG